MRTRTPISALLSGLPLLILLCLPLVGLIWTTSAGDIARGLNHSVFDSALWLSIKTTLGSLMLIIGLGTPLSWWLANTHHRLRKVVNTLIDIPIILPPAVVGLGLLQVFGQQGLLGDTLQVFELQIPFTPLAVVIAQVVIATPYYVHTAVNAFGKIDPELMLVARSLGRGPWYNFRRLVLPLSLPGMVSGAALAWARALGEFGATLLFAGNLSGVTQTMPLGIYMTLESNPQVAVALALVLALTSIGILTLVRLVPALLNRKTEQDSINGEVQ